MFVLTLKDSVLRPGECSRCPASDGAGDHAEQVMMMMMMIIMLMMMMTMSSREECGGSLVTAALREVGDPPQWSQFRIFSDV